MPKPVLTESQRALLDYVNTKRITEGPQIDSGSFAKLMLHPEYAELVRKNIARPGNWDKPGDSAAFYDEFRSDVSKLGPLTREDVPESQVRSSREGRYDTITTPTVGNLKGRTYVEFKPSVLQSAKERIGELFNSKPKAAEPDTTPSTSAGDDIVSMLSGLTPFARGLRMSPASKEPVDVPKSGGDLLVRVLSAKPKLDAVSGAAAKAKR